MRTRFSSLGREVVFRTVACFTATWIAPEKTFYGVLGLRYGGHFKGKQLLFEAHSPFPPSVIRRAPKACGFAFRTAIGKDQIEQSAAGLGQASAADVNTALMFLHDI
jgi:hypothetical protein